MLLYKLIDLIDILMQKKNTIKWALLDILQQISIVKIGRDAYGINFDYSFEYIYH